MVLLLGETEVPRKHPPVQPAYHKPSHVLMLGIEPSATMMRGHGADHYASRTTDI